MTEGSSRRSTLTAGSAVALRGSTIDQLLMQEEGATKGVPVTRPPSLPSVGRATTASGVMLQPVNFMRLAIVDLRTTTKNDWNVRTDVHGVQLTCTQMGTPEDFVRLLLSAEVPLGARPEKDENDYIVVDDDVIRRAEQCIEEFADFASVALQAGRSISSPEPEASFSAVGASDRAWLDDSNGLLLPGTSLAWIRDEFPPGDSALRVGSRFDGVALLAEALSNEHPTGRFRELLRLFERAFTCGPHTSIGPLSASCLTSGSWPTRKMRSLIGWTTCVTKRHTQTAVKSLHWPGILLRFWRASNSQLMTCCSTRRIGGRRIRSVARSGSREPVSCEMAPPL